LNLLENRDSFAWTQHLIFGSGIIRKLRGIVKTWAKILRI
jgi:hypothetical protein